MSLPAMPTRALLVNENKPSPLTEAFVDLGIDVHRNHWQPSADLLGKVSACFVSFYDCLTHPLRVFRLRRCLAAKGIPLVAWNRDAPGYMNKPGWQLDCLERFKLIDIYASHALPDRRRFAETQILLHNGVNDNIYHLNGTGLDALDDPARYRYDVSFFGAIDASRYKEYVKRQDFFSRLSGALIDRNISFNFIDTLKTPLTAAQQIRLIQTSRINLNFDAGCEYGSAHGYGLPERCFGIPACGGFLLSDFRTHAADAFPPAEEWADFDDFAAALTKIEYYLAHFDEARQIARKAHRRVMREHTYRHRAEQMLAAIEQWHAARRPC